MFLQEVLYIKKHKTHKTRDASYDAEYPCLNRIICTQVTSAIKDISQLRRQRVSTVTYYPVSWLNIPNTTDYTDTFSTLMKQKCNLHPSAHTSNNVLRDAPPMYTTRAAQLRSFCWLLYPAKN